jgi:hypothetical protein
MASRPDPSPEIRGGAGPFEAAAIVAVVQHVLEREAVAAATPAPRNVPNAWVRAAAARPFGRFVPPVGPDAGWDQPT